MKRLASAVLAGVLAAAAVPAHAARPMEMFRACAYRQYRFIPPWAKSIKEGTKEWELHVCSTVETDGETIRIVSDKPDVGVDVAAPWKPIWVINNCSGWNVMRSDGTAWVHGECEVSWRVWMGPVPVEVASWTVQQEFTYAADGYQDIYYPAFFRGKTFESPTPLE